MKTPLCLDGPCCNNMRRSRCRMKVRKKKVDSACIIGRPKTNHYTYRRPMAYYYGLKPLSIAINGAIINIGTFNVLQQSEAYGLDQLSIAITNIGSFNVFQESEAFGLDQLSIAITGAIINIGSFNVFQESEA